MLFDDYFLVKKKTCRSVRKPKKGVARASFENEYTWAPTKASSDINGGRRGLHRNRAL